MTATFGLFIFDIGWSELVVIGVVALIAIGPKELPAVLRTFGQYMRKIKRMASEFQSQLQQVLREADLSELKQHARDIHSTVTDFTKYDPRADIGQTPTQPGSSASETVVRQPVWTETAAADPAIPLPAIQAPIPEPTAPRQELVEPVHPAQKQA